MLTVSVKICGLKEMNTVKTAVVQGAAYAGFVFFKQSPRHVTITECSKLSKVIPSKVKKVAVTVNPTNEFLISLFDEVSLDYVQLHGNETPKRVEEVKKITGVKIIKAVSIEDNSDIDDAMTFKDSADMILFDAKPPKTGLKLLPGGNAIVFDWTLLASRIKDLSKINWILSGGLNIDNVKQAVRITGAQIIDVSSGVETAPGFKDIDKITKFIEVANELRTRS